MDFAGKRILIVEDEGLVAMVLETFLEAFGCVIAAVASRLDTGMEAAKQSNFDAAVLDVNLAGQMSYPIAELLRDRKIPFFFATGYGTTGLPLSMRGIPVLAKPFRREDLAAALAAAHTP